MITADVINKVLNYFINQNLGISNFASIFSRKFLPAEGLNRAVSF